eukprot:8037665-Pyramimonas_sp.AAC.1
MGWAPYASAQGGYGVMAQHHKPKGLSDVLRKVLSELGRTTDNVLIQLWFPGQDDSGNRVLVTKDAPYVIMGVGDAVGDPACAARFCARHPHVSDPAWTEGCNITSFLSGPPMPVTAKGCSQHPRYVRI